MKRLSFENQFNGQRLVQLSALMIYLFTALNSSGFHHPDEHYQVIQFANYKRGLVNLQEMPWEYGYKMRPGLQPLICYLIFSFLTFIGVTDPFTLALSLRLFMSTVSFLSIGYFIKKAGYLVPTRHQILFSFLSYYIWFLPYINVRFSSESLSGIIFLLGMGQALEINTKSLKGSAQLGATLGLSILIRYQSAFMVFGLLCWLLVNRKYNLAQIGIVITLLLIIAGVDVGIDKWLYGEFTFAPYNYYKANIIDDIASQFGVSPWYHIIYYILISSWLPIGLMILSCFLLICFNLPKNIVTWCALPFLVVHALIGHKELRFLFPLANQVPLAIMLALPTLERLPLRKIFLICMVTPVLIFNMCALIFMAMESTRAGENKIAECIYRNFKTQDINLLASYNSNPYEPYMHYAHNFYKSDSTRVIQISSIWQPGFDQLLKRSSINLLVLSNDEITGPLAFKKLARLGAKKMCTQKNSIFGSLSDIYDKNLYNGALTLYFIPFPAAGNK
jgi:phosphatidylinositol glycan class B